MVLVSVILVLHWLAIGLTRLDKSSPVSPTRSGFRYFLVSWTANSSCRDPARYGDNKLFAYRRGAVSRRRLANKKLLTICKTLTWCQAALCFRLLSATAAEGKQRRVFFSFLFCIIFIHFPRPENLKGLIVRQSLCQSFPTTICVSFLSMKLAANEKKSTACFSCWLHFLVFLCFLFTSCLLKQKVCWHHRGHWHLYQAGGRGCRHRLWDLLTAGRFCRLAKLANATFLAVDCKHRARNIVFKRNRIFFFFKIKKN